MLGCDGASGVVRTSMGVGYEGVVDARQNLAAVFRAAGLADRVPHGPAIQYWVLQPGASVYMSHLDLGDRWWIGLIGVAADLDAAAVWAHIASAVGGPLDLRLLGTDPWIGRLLNAGRYVAGNVLLAGDAAHLYPPWGGHGFNAGVGDAVNAAWKIAAVLHGWGGPELEPSYEQEWLPDAAQTIDIAMRQSGRLSRTSPIPGCWRTRPRAMPPGGPSGRRSHGSSERSSTRSASSSGTTTPARR